MKTLKKIEIAKLKGGINLRIKTIAPAKGRTIGLRVRTIGLSDCSLNQAADVV